ncbi:MAG TPA: biotin synthase BioB, partial [Polyangiaceae bacterium LLY-WYZ-15_(1-7)]|nr:biotin synthase BioB [Polyangiaceae bacterium LLY-WYZ-15_(1-7)]
RSGRAATSPLVTELRHDWTVAEARAIHDLPLLELLFRAQEVHRANHPPDAVQLCTLLSIKTGACSEDCAYCPQSGRHDAELEPERLLSVDEVLSKAKKAKDAGATRFCMGAAWRDARKGPQFEQVLDMVRGVRALGLEACCTLGMLTDEQAEALAEAGLSAYNHNLDSSKEFYGEIITTRTYQERLETIQRVSQAGISVCSGGIIGMGETDGDRVAMLATLANLDPQPESVPINALVAVPGTPLEDQPPVDPLELVRMCATARIMLPKSMVRLSAGRTRLNREAQLLCFMAGANSIFYGEKLLTTGNPDVEADLGLLREAGMRALIPEDPAKGAPKGAEPLPPRAVSPAE